MGDSERFGTEASGPLVSIGMPTYNGSRFIARSIESLLAQDYRNWRLLISDNCSTDETESIARDYVRRDPRISYMRQVVNVGASGNFTYLLREATGKYFMWAADHDLWAPNHVSTCIAALEANPGAVIAYPESELIDGDGRYLAEQDDQLDLSQASPLLRYKRAIWLLYNCNMIYGVGRREAFAATGGFPDSIGPDHLVLARMALQGTIVRTGGRLFFRRENRPPETDDEARKRQLMDMNPDDGVRRAALPPVRLYRKLRDLHVRAVWSSSLGFGEKLEASLATLACFRDRFGVRSITFGAVWHVAWLARRTRALDRRTGIGDEVAPATGDAR